MTQDDDLFTNLINNNKNTKTCCGCHLIPNSPELRLFPYTRMV